ncbi:MAG: hypothetical protein ACXWP5_08990 [Bdellovibrionota bacterium]
MAPNELFKNQKTAVSIEDRGGGSALLRIDGILDEDTDLSKVLPAVEAILKPGQILDLDLDRMTRMNSTGLKSWLALMEKLSPAFNCRFFNVREIFIEQANMISLVFGQTGRLMDFYAPYYCTDCKIETSHLLKPDDVRFEKGVAVSPNLSCPKCGKRLEFGWFEEEFLGHVQGIRH